MNKEPLCGSSNGPVSRLEPYHGEVLDVVGVGFGPSNLALAIAIDEHNRSTRGCDQLSRAFFERQPRFGWHRGMLIDDATMQVSYLKDLVTRRSPSSDFSFLSYLHEVGRLDDFINHKTLFPLRIEFHAYLEWAAQRMEGVVDYGCEVIDVRPVTDAGSVSAFDVVIRSGPCPGEVFVRRARNVVVAVGLQMSLPLEAKLSERVWHNADLLGRLDALPDDPPPRRFLVLGAGQSAAESVGYLHRRFLDAEICSVFTSFGYSPADDSPFANRVFDPAAVDTHFSAPATVKKALLDYHRNTNYSVVDQELIEELYRRVYCERVQGCQRLRILNASRLVNVVAKAEGVEATVEHLPTCEVMTLACDVVIYATGYRPLDVFALLGTASKILRRNDDGMVRVERDYRVVTTTFVQGGIYLQGGTEHSHGLSSSLLSNIAVRSGEIVQSVANRRAGRRIGPSLAGSQVRS